MNFDFEYIRYSEKAILIKGASVIEESLSEKLILYKKSIEINLGKVIVEVVLSYNSLLVFYHSTIENVYSAVFDLKSVFELLNEMPVEKKKVWEIPVCYDVSLVSDLALFLKAKSLTLVDLIKLHTSPLYTVYFLGFLPGFMYLGGLDKKLMMPRKENPDLKVTKGSVAIGGDQTGVYPMNSPGGWHVIGKTPLSFFDVTKEKCCFVSEGDMVRFISINVNKYNDISLLNDKNDYMPNFTFL